MQIKQKKIHKSNVNAKLFQNVKSSTVFDFYFYFFKWLYEYIYIYLFKMLCVITELNDIVSFVVGKRGNNMLTPKSLSNMFPVA